METSNCSLCGLRRTHPDVLGLAWTSQHAPDGAVSWICPGCTRAQLWQIETGVPLERAALSSTAARAA